MKYIFGPVQSRRLGRSLGVDLLGKKICTLNCVYCEVGPTVCLTCERAEYAPGGEILAEVERFCRQAEQGRKLDVVTVTASGEPTLHQDFGRLLGEIKKIARRPVAVLTNSTTLPDPGVQTELQVADIVVPSLDAARLPAFLRVDRPATCLDLEEIIEALVRFSREYTGQLWLEILLVRGLNDSEEDIRALEETLSRMRIDRIQLNTVARPPVEPFARPVSGRRLREVGDLLNKRTGEVPVDLLAVVSGQAECGNGDDRIAATRADERQRVLEEIIQMLKRRPCTAAEIHRCFAAWGQNGIEQLLEPLVRDGTLQKQRHGDRIFYQHATTA